LTEYISQTLPDILRNTPLLAILLVFLGGLATSLGPCNISMAPVIIGYIGGQEDISRRRAFALSLAFTIGSSITFVILGLIAATVGVIAGRWHSLLYWLVALVCFIIGLNLLGLLKINLDFMSRFQPKRIIMQGLLGALLFGLVVGLTGSQCGMPVLVVILGAVMAKGQLAYGALLLFVYGLGRGIPIILVGTFTGLIKALPKLERFSRVAQKAAGLVLIIIGLYFVWIS